MEELETLGDITRAANGDAQLLWAAQGQPDGNTGAGVRAWRHGGALAVASPGLSGRSRLAIGGDDAADAASLLRHALAEVGTSYRVFGAAQLIGSVLPHLGEVTRTGRFYWMDTSSRPGVTASAARWLDSDEVKAAASLFDEFFPDSYAQPGRDGVRRWAGIGDTTADGSQPVETAPLALAADAWSAAGCGFMAGVVTHPAARGRGLARAVCGFVLDALVSEYGRAALMVHHDNPAALATYERLGMTRRLLRAAEVTTL